MKNIQPVVLIVLLAAVTYLMVDKFSAPKVEEPVEVEEQVIEDEPDFKVAYINIDSLNNNYQFILDNTEKLELEGKKIQSRIQNKYKKADNRMAELQQQLPTMTQAQYQAAEKEMQDLGIEIQNYEKAQGEKLQKMQIKLQEQIQNQLDSFLIPFKSEYDFIFSFGEGSQMLHGKTQYEITDSLLGIMNEAYFESKQEEESKQ